jgi:hypothetical protein
MAPAIGVSRNEEIGDDYGDGSQVLDRNSAISLAAHCVTVGLAVYAGDRNDGIERRAGDARRRDVVLDHGQPAVTTAGCERRGALQGDVSHAGEQMLGEGRPVVGGVHDRTARR